MAELSKSAIAGTSSLGITFGFGIETVAGQKPATFTQLDRINNIAGITLETETIDASALEDLVERSVAGRQSSGGSWAITVNVTTATMKEWEELIKDSTEAYTEGKATWFEVVSPYLNRAFFVTAQVPQVMPLPEFAQNELQTVEVTLTINEYKGLGTKVELTTNEYQNYTGA